MPQPPCSMLDDIDDCDLDALDTLPALASTGTDDGSRWEPTLPKCPHCDDNGQVVASSHERIDPRRPDVPVINRMFTDCPHCDGAGFLGVPTDQETKVAFRSAGRSSDVALLMRARLDGGLDLWTGKPMRNAAALSEIK